MWVFYFSFANKTDSKDINLTSHIYEIEKHDDHINMFRRFCFLSFDWVSFIVSIQFINHCLIEGIPSKAGIWNLHLSIVIYDFCSSKIVDNSEYFIFLAN